MKWREAAIAVLGLGCLALTADRIVPAEAARLERPGSINGSTYTVIAPIYTGSDGNISYLRFFNPNSSDVTFAVTVVGTPSGRVYGVANYDVPSNASPQYPISGQSDAILTRASAGALNGGDTGYALYLKAPPINAINGFQHVIYNANNSFFENVSACTYSPNVDYSDFNQMLINVHTTTIAAYPVNVTIHNYQSAPVDYDVTVFDARDGSTIGDVVISLGANETKTLPESWFESQLQFSPAANQFHVNMTFAPTVDQGGPTAIVSQAIYNQRLAAYISMTLFCSVNP